MVRFCIDSMSTPSLFIPSAFLLTACAFLYRQHGISVTDRPLCVSAHRECVSTLTAMSFPSLIVPSAFLLSGCTYLPLQGVISVADHPLRVSAHSSCVSALTACHFRR